MHFIIFVSKTNHMHKKVLAKFLNCPVNKIFQGIYGYNSYTDIGIDYLVMTEEEANKEAKRHVWSFISSFDCDFLNNHLVMRIPEDKLADLLTKGCECCQLVIAAFIPNYERFLDEAILKYGREYFLCFEDKTEYRVTYRGKEYCVYRLV